MQTYHHYDVWYVLHGVARVIGDDGTGNCDALGVTSYAVDANGFCAVGAIQRDDDDVSNVEQRLLSATFVRRERMYLI